MNNLILVRHGQSLWNKERKFTGFMDIELTEKGKEAARTSLKKLLLQLDIKIVFCSPFIRCQQTIHPFIERIGLTVNVENCLQEIYWDPKFLDLKFLYLKFLDTKFWI